MVDTKKVEEQALADVNKAETWVDTHPRLATGLAFVLGVVGTQFLHWVHLLK